MALSGRPKKVKPKHLLILRDIVTEKPLMTLAEILDAFVARTGVEMHIGTLSKSLQEAGITRQKGAHHESADHGNPAPEAEPSKRYGYVYCHRQQAPEQCYPSCLTDAEWELVDDIFDGDIRRGTPPRYPRRLLVDACCYVVRNHCSWRKLPQEFPPWQNVYRTFRRWSEQGKFEQMNDRLRAQWRKREGALSDGHG